MNNLKLIIFLSCIPIFTLSSDKESKEAVIEIKSTLEKMQANRIVRPENNDLEKGTFRGVAQTDFRTNEECRLQLIRRRKKRTRAIAYAAIGIAIVPLIYQAINGGCILSGSGALCQNLLSQATLNATGNFTV